MDNQSNRSAQQSHISEAEIEQINPHRVKEIFLQDLSSLQQSPNFTSQSYLDGLAYSILFTRELKFYFVNGDFIVRVPLPQDFGLQSARNVFMFEAKQQVLGLSGCIVIAFGLNNYMLIHIDHQYTQESNIGYNIIFIKEYQNITRQKEQLSTVMLSNEKIEPVSRTRFQQQELMFYLGASNDQKLIAFTIVLRQDQNVSSYQFSSVMSNCEERIIYQEPKTFVSRIGNFLSSKLNYGSGDQENGESSSCIKDIHVVDNFIIMTTNKDLIILRQSDGVKLVEKEYFDKIKELSLKNDQFNSFNVMRETLEFRLLTSSAVNFAARNSICINLYIVQQQMIQNPQTHQTTKHTRIINKKILFLVNETRTELAEPLEQRDDQIYFYDITNSEIDLVAKAFTFSYEVVNQNILDINILLILEYKNGKILGIQHAMTNSLDSIVKINNQNLYGYSVQLQNDQEFGQVALKLILITRGDVSMFSYFISEQTFREADVQSLSSVIQNEAILRQQMYINQQAMDQPFNYNVEGRILNRQDYIQRLRHCLEQVALYVFGQKVELERQKISTVIKQQVEILRQLFNDEELIAEISKIMFEQMDLPISDSRFEKGRYNDELQQAQYDDGIVQTSLDQKKNKLQIFQTFIEEMVLPVILNTNTEFVTENIFSDINGLKFKILVAEAFRNIQQKIILQASNSDYRFGQQYPLDLRLLAKIINRTARLFKPQNEIENQGITSGNVIFSNINQFDAVIFNLIDISINKHMNQQMDLLQGEDSAQVANEGLRILVQILEHVLIEENMFVFHSSFMSTQEFLDMFFTLIETCKRGMINTQIEDLKTLLLEASKKFMFIFNTMPEEFKRNHQIFLPSLVTFLEECLSPQDALEFADENGSQMSLCRLVFKIGPSTYQRYIIENVFRWRESDFLGTAIQTIYKEEQALIKERQHAKNKGESLPPYRGLQIFDIFEENFPNQLGQFLQAQNKKLFGLFLVRQGRIQESDQVMSQVVQQVLDVDTLRSISSIASVNIDMIQNAGFDQKKKYEAFLNVASAQHSIYPNQTNLLPPSLEIMSSFLNKEIQETNNHQNALRSTLHLLNNYALINEFNPDFNDIKYDLWQRVINHDKPNIIEVLKIIEQGKGEVPTYVSEQIVKRIRTTLLFALADNFRNTPAGIDPDLEKRIIEQYQDLEGGIRPILLHRLPSTDYSAIEFGQPFSSKGNPPQIVDENDILY